MALYHLTAKTGSRSSGHSALAKAQYIQREAAYARVPDAVAYTTSGNLPSFAAGSAAAYWDAADVYERANGRLFKEVEFALPLELDAGQQRTLAESFVEDLVAGERLPYTLAIHEGHGRNPHCHVLVSERANDGIDRPASQWFRRWNSDAPDQGGARKTESLKPREWLDHIREKWAELANRALERAGFLERVDHRSLEAQGIDREPQIHLGPNVVRMEERGLRTERADWMLRIDERNAELSRTRTPRARTDRTQETPDRERPGPNPNRPPNDAPERGAQLTTASRGRAAQPAELAAEPADTSRVSAELAAQGRDRAVGERELEAHAAATRRAAERDRAEPPRHELDTLPGRDHLHPGRSEHRPPGESARTDPHEREPATRGAGSHGRGALPGYDREGADPGRQADGLDPTDRTARAVARQLRAMGCPRYEVGIRDRQTGQMLERSWSAEQAQEHVPWLKHMNARGNDIYIRPEREHARGLVLLDDLSPAALAKLERDARGPALAIETSRENYQAWVRVPGRASEAERGEIGQRLSREYDADPASTSPRQYGRLAGFTNQKEIHRDPDGLPPFTLLRSATGRAAEDGELLLRQATRSLREQARAASRARPTPALSSRAAAQNVERAIEIFRGRFAELSQSIDDRSRCDFGAAVTLVDRGFDRATIAQAIRAESPDLEARKPGHVDDYVQRTAQAAILARSRSAEREGPERSGPAVAQQPHTPDVGREAAELFQRHDQQVRQVMNDPGYCDFSAACRLARAGYSAETIERTLRTESPDLERRKGSDVERYVRGTAKSAIEAQARELQRDRDRDQGWER